MPVTPTDAGKTVNLLDLLQQEFGAVHAVHRLDRDTSGVVLFARNADMKRLLETAFRDHAIQKTYVALVRGVPREQGERDTYLKLIERGKGWEKWGTGKGQGALQAITTWRLKEQFGSIASLMQVQPQTGRTHQIRVHFAEMGHPLLGDRIYGDRQEPIAVSRHQLHAATLKMPFGGNSRMFRAPMPQDMKQAIAALKQQS